MNAGLPSIAVLGPFEVSMDGTAVTVPSGRLRGLLTVLAMAAGETVSVERLVAALWDEDVPENARRAVQLYVTRLRAQLGKDLIETRPAGYALRVSADQVDALRFVRLLAAAAAEPGGPQERKLLREALALWRGQPFEGVQSSWLEESEAAALAERYLWAVERRLELDIADGRAGEAVAELAELTAEHPLRETLWARWLVALAACDRQAEALERYELIRARLAEELGTDPGAELQAAYAELLAGRVPSLPGSGRAPRVPRQLPPDVARFTGRRPALRELAALLGDGDGGSGGPVIISAIDGTAGIGKSALAIRAAHQMLPRYPDGQLYVDLQGATPGLRPLAPLEVLGRFLRALGIDPSAVPTGEAEASTRFRSETAGQRMLVVLDNAADAEQVGPLLPGPGCAVLVTSRQVLSTLQGVRHLHLDLLTAAEATELLGRLAGAGRVAAEPEAAAGIARLCGYLPLALRVAAARLAARPSWPLRALLERLASARGRLDELQTSNLGVRASFAVSLDQLRASDDPVDQRAAEAFPLLGILCGPDCGTMAAARLLGQAEPEAEHVLERLVDAQLLAAPAPGRYRLHDVLRLFAREIAERDHQPRQRAAALTRALGYYNGCAWRTLELLRPGDYRLTRADPRWRKDALEFADGQAALIWLQTEHGNLLAAVEQAASTPGVPAVIAIQLAQALCGYLWASSLWNDLVQVNRTALTASRRRRDQAAQAQAHRDLGAGLWRLGRFAEAIEHLQQGLTLSRQRGDGIGQASSLSVLGCIYTWQGDYAQAEMCQQESLDLYRDVGYRRGESITLTNLGDAYERQGRYAEAIACHEQSLAIDTELGDRRGRAEDLTNLGSIYLQQGRFAQATACLRESLELHGELADRRGQASSLNKLGVLYQRRGHPDQALSCLQQALALYRDMGEPYSQAETLRDLGITLHALGRLTEARQHLLEALDIFDRLQSTDADQVRALLRLLSGRHGGAAF